MVGEVQWRDQSHGGSRGALAGERKPARGAGRLSVHPADVSGYTIFVIGPILAAIGISFTSYDMLTPASTIGLANYTQLLSDPRLRTVYLNTFFFTVLAVTFNISVGPLLAVMINRRMPAVLRYLFRTAYFFPTLVALVYCAIIWQFLYQKDTGIINYYLSFLDVAPIPWLSSTSWVMPSIIILDVWKNTGSAMLVFLAGLQNISPEYYESAQLDGANRLQLFRHITLPLITPTLFFNIIIYMIGALQVFDSIVALTNGGPGDASRSSGDVYCRDGLPAVPDGLRPAIAITLFVIIMILTLLQFRLGQRWVHYE